MSPHPIRIMAAILLALAVPRLPAQEERPYARLSWFSPLYLQTDRAFNSVWPHDAATLGFEIASLRLGIVGGRT